MRSRDYTIATTQLKPRRERVFVALLIAAGLTLLVLGRANHPAILSIKSGILTGTEPVLSVLASPVASMKHAAADVRAFFATNRLNHTLKAENDSLRHWQATALALKAENEALRRLSEYQPVEGVSFVTARVLASSMGDFSQSLTLNVGSDDGVTNLAPVVDAYGVIGRVVDVTKKASRVLLITDVASRLPVVTAHSRQRAILTGTGSELMRLRYLSGTGAPTLGEAVATTHEGGLVPGGIAVGTVFKQDEAGYLIKPLRPVASAEYVRVVLFSDGSR